LVHHNNNNNNNNNNLLTASGFSPGGSGHPVAVVATEIRRLLHFVIA
jgi:hypothetical protein